VRAGTCPRRGRHYIFGATVGAGIAVLVALCLLLATAHYRRRFTAAEARVADLEIQFER
jgi:hypothetical protein